MRKHLGLAALALAGALGLGSGPALAVDVTIWCWDTNFNGAAMREAAARYNATHPDVNIIIDDSDTQDNIRLKLQTQLLAGTTEGLRHVLIQTTTRRITFSPSRARSSRSRLDRLTQFAKYKVAAAPSTASPTRCPSTRASSPLLSLRLLRGAGFTTRTCRTHLGPADRDRRR